MFICVPKNYIKLKLKIKSLRLLTTNYFKVTFKNEILELFVQKIITKKEKFGQNLKILIIKVKDLIENQ